MEASHITNDTTLGTQVRMGGKMWYLAGYDTDSAGNVQLTLYTPEAWAREEGRLRLLQKRIRQRSGKTKEL
jgi:hypothetical protein